MIQRDPKYYTAGSKANDPEQAPLYLRALVFDGPEADLNLDLVNKFNEHMREKDMFPGCRIKPDRDNTVKVPSKIIVLNASHDNLPTSYETGRIFEDFCARNGYKISVKVVNTRDELMKEVKGAPDEILIMSQCVDKYVYDVTLAGELERSGAVIVPGKVTAPGGVFSDKDSTYSLLSDAGKQWGEVARYRKVLVDSRSVEEVVQDIFNAVDELVSETGDETFFIKPHEGGGGLGGFRITKRKKGYIIPDLSKVTGDDGDIHPTFIDFDDTSDAKLRELLWIYRLFSRDEKMAENYLKVDLPIKDADDAEAIKILRKYLQDIGEKQKAKLNRMIMEKGEAAELLAGSIKMFEKKFNRRYNPLVNEHLDFGLWGLRAHYRLTEHGPQLETIYHRVFQLGFTEEGLGYVGADNISNKQTGELEITRLGPINEIMLESIGGKNALFEVLLKGAKALVILAGLVSPEERNRVPLRVQLDLAAVSKRIGEGNADTARGLSIASRWGEFMRNTSEWLEDALVYYSWKKGKQ